MLRVIVGAILLCYGLGVSVPTLAQTSTDGRMTALEHAKGRLIPLLKGEMAADEYFTGSFLAAVPAAQFKSLTDQLIKEHGQPVSIIETERKSENIAVLELEFEKAFARIDMTVDPATRKVSGLFLSNIEKRGDSGEKIKADFEALPGSAGYAVVRLSNGKTPELVAGSNTDKQFAIASTFKLYILAELADQIAKGARKWDDVAPLTHRSFSSLATRNWPEDSPVTLNTLALQMVSVSDNSATDTLLHILGRQKVSARVQKTGHSDPQRIYPFLSTSEAFALKGNAELRRVFLDATETGQRELLKNEKALLSYEAINPDMFASQNPKHIDTIEWFASPKDIANLLDHVLRSRNDRMLEIMSANAGPAESRRIDWNYIGYKGGSEPGVISMSFLGQAKDGQWYAITGSWNDTDKPVDEDKFSNLMTRLMDSVSGFME